VYNIISCNILLTYNKTLVCMYILGGVFGREIHIKTLF